MAKKTTKKPLLKQIKKPTKVKPNSRLNGGGKRVRTLPEHRTFNLTKSRLKSPKQLPKISQLIKHPSKLIFANKKIFLGLAFFYSLISFIFINGFGSSFDLRSFQEQLNDFFGKNTKNLETSYLSFTHLLGNLNKSASDTTSTYQLFLGLFLVLAVIWLCRKIIAGEKTSVKEAFYKGMYPIIPFILVIFVISIQLIPLSIGSFLVTTVFGNGLAVTAIEKGLWLIAFGLFALLSLYMITSSIFALFIVTLNDITPLQALRSARELVLHRRLGVFARLVILPLLIFIVLAVIFMPMVVFLPVIAEPVFLFIASFSIIFSITYLYNFYRALL